MKYFLNGVLTGLLLILLCVICSMNHRITNLERQLVRVERGYNEVLEANEQLERINEQNLRLMAEGGWDGTISMGAGY